MNDTNNNNGGGEEKKDVNAIDWDAQSDGIFEFEVTIALNMQASSPTSTTLNENPTSFDESNFAAIDARLLMRYCGGSKGGSKSNADSEKIGNERNVRVYRARLSKIQHRCNDRAGLLEEAGAGAADGEGRFEAADTTADAAADAAMEALNL